MIIKTKSNKKFGIDPQDWIFWDEKVKSKLEELHSNGFRIIVFTN